MNLQPHSQSVPRHVRRGQLEQILRNMLDGQENFSLVVWELFNSLGYQIDCQTARLERINERMWALEHPRRRRHEQ